MPVPFRLPTIKALFAEATHCAYPLCPDRLVFEDAQRGVRTIAVQIAHIRSAKTGGPRHDPGYPTEQLNEEGNLLLLCGKHHPAVDQNESVFTTNELLAWKSDQVAQAGGTEITEADIAVHARTLQSSLDAVLDVFRAAVTVCLTGAEALAGGITSMPLDSLGRVTVAGTPAGERFVSVQVVNSSAVGIDVVSAGMELDISGDGGSRPRWDFMGGTLNPGFPYRLEGRSTKHWYIPLTTAQRGLGALPLQRVRAVAYLGDGSLAVGDWVGMEEIRDAGRAKG